MFLKELHMAIPLMMSFGIGAAFVGCDEGDPVVDTSGLGVSSALPAVVNEDETISDKKLANDGPVLPVEMMWLEHDAKKPVRTNALSMELINRSDMDYSVVVSLRCTGLFNMMRQAEIGRYELPAKGNVVVSANAARFPIQVTEGLAQVAMVAALESASIGEAANSATYVSPFLYYRHDAGYAAITLLGDETVLEQERGTLLSVPERGDKAAVAMGRVLDEKGVARSVTSEDGAFVVMSDGKVAGRITGMSISVGSVDEELAKELSR